MSKFRNYDNYDVFEDGRIWSYKTKIFLKPYTRKDGYQQVNLSDNEGKRKSYLLHRVVYEAVTGEPIPKGFEINHRSEVKTENMITNLELMSHKQNVNYGSGIERSHKALTNNQKISKAVGAFKDGKLVMTFPSISECGRQGFNQGNVCSCCRNCLNKPGNNKYKGFEWRYI